MSGNQEIDVLLSGVVKENGRPVMISPYGFKVGIIDGKQYLVAMTKDECDHFVKNQDKPLAGYCAIDDYGRCYHTNNSGPCTLTTEGSRVVCICIS